MSWIGFCPIFGFLILLFCFLLPAWSSSSDSSFSPFFLSLLRLLFLIVTSWSCVMIAIGIIKRHEIETWGLHNRWYENTILFFHHMTWHTSRHSNIPWSGNESEHVTWWWSSGWLILMRSFLLMIISNSSQLYSRGEKGGITISLFLKFDYNGRISF